MKQWKIVFRIGELKTKELVFPESQIVCEDCDEFDAEQIVDANLAVLKRGILNSMKGFLKK